MALIRTVSPESAEGNIKEHYSVFIQRAGFVPKPFEMMSVSPELLKTQGSYDGSFQNGCVLV